MIAALILKIIVLVIRLSRRQLFKTIKLLDKTKTYEILLSFLVSEVTLKFEMSVCQPEAMFSMLFNRFEGTMVINSGPDFVT